MGYVYNSKCPKYATSAFNLQHYSKYEGYCKVSERRERGVLPAYESRKKRRCAIMSCHVSQTHDAPQPSEYSRPCYGVLSSSQSPDASGHVGMAEFLTYPFNSFILTLDRFKLLASCGVSHHVTLVLLANSIGHGMGRFAWVY